MWYASHSVMHPEGKMKGYYRHATLGEIGELCGLSGRLAWAVLTLSTDRLDAVVTQVEAVHARIDARRKAAP